MAQIGMQNMIGGSFVDRQPQQGSGGGGVTVLPLNLLALIISYLDDTADLARVCSTCRVLYYMTLPQLYKDITLVSYDTIRYRGQRPEGCGSASPFSMGLNAIVTRNIASLVQSLTLRGEWKEHDIEEHGKVGRVPDNSMMLNIAVRAAIDRTTALQSFTWDLNTKMLSPIYGGLVTRQTLKSLTIRFPTTRHPRPTVNVPGFPQLESLKVTHIDPLCYPDDISSCLLQSPKLHTLKMHFSPRMRAESEPSVNLHYFFRKVMATPNFKLGLRTMAYQNLFAIPNHDEFETIFDHEKLENITVLNSTGDDEISGGPISFIDASFDGHKPPPGIMRVKSVRFDKLSRKHADSLSHMFGLEKMYFVSAPPEPYPPPSLSNSSHNSLAIANGTSSSDHTTPITPSTAYSPNTPTVSSTPSNKNAFRDSFLSALFTNHGTTLQHLLLPSRWLLNSDTIARLVRCCPNLTQLGIAVEKTNLESVRLLLSFLPKLRAIRLLRSGEPGSGSTVNISMNSSSSSDTESATSLSQKLNSVQLPPDITESCKDISKGKQKNLLTVNPSDGGAAGIELERDEVHIMMMGRLLATNPDEYAKLKYVGLGRKVFEIGGLELVDVPDYEATSENEGKKVWRRRVRRIPEERVMHMEIWGLDTADI